MSDEANERKGHYVETNKPTEDTEVKQTQMKPEKMMVRIRSFQYFSVAMSIAGAVWASAEFMVGTVLVKSPVNPISVLMIVYGVVGAFASEMAIRMMETHIVKQKRFLSEPAAESTSEEGKSANG
jgi:hypothetical protein